MKIKKLTLLLLCTTLPLLAKNKPEPVQVKEIIGSGIVQINNNRNFMVDDTTTVYLDKDEIDYTTFEIIGSGYKSTFIIEEDSNSSFNTGTIDVIKLETDIIGPITSINPFRVLSQAVLKTADTKTALLQSQQIGDIVSVSGYLNQNNSLKSTHIATQNSTQYWKLRGYVSNKNSQEFSIGDLLFNFNNNVSVACDNGFDDGSLIEAKMSPELNYQAGMPITNLLSVECLKSNQLDSSQTSEVASVLQGFISATQGQDFWLNDIRINTSNATLYENGEKQFIEEAVNVEVQGVFNPVSLEFQAEAVRFIDHRIEIEFPVQNEDIVLNESVLINGVVFNITPQTQDTNNILSQGLSQSRQVSIKGYVDSLGVAYISSIKNKGNVNFNNIVLRGDIGSVNNPLFSLLNFTVDAQSSLIINFAQGVIDTATFFNLIEQGSSVQISSGEFDLNTGIISNARITINQSVQNKSASSTDLKEIIGSGIIGLYGTATISSTNEQLFYSSFE